MKITNIIEIPSFISSYINKGIDDIDYQLHSFCRFLLNRKIDSFKINEDESYQFEYIINETCYDIKYFINFYLSKSELNCKYECLYETETDISKSVANEIFIVELETDDGSKLDTVEVIIDCFASDKLILKSV